MTRTNYTLSQNEIDQINKIHQQNFISSKDQDFIWDTFINLWDKTPSGFIKKCDPCINDMLGKITAHIEEEKNKNTINNKS